MADESRELLLLLNAEEHDEEQLADLTRLLQAELRQLDVNQVERIDSRDVPEGAKVGAAAVVGALAVKLGPALVGPVIRAVRSWLSRGRDRSAVLVWKGNKIKVTGVSSEEQERLIEAWMRLVERGCAL